MKKVVIVLISVLLSLLIFALVFHIIKMDKPFSKKVLNDKSDINITEQTKESSSKEILCKKFAVNISEYTEIIYFKSDTAGTKAALVISEEEYNGFISDLKQSGYGKLEDFERIPKNISDLSQLPSQYAVFRSNGDWMSVYDVSEVYSVFINENGKRCVNEIYITDTINGFMELYLITNR